MFDLLLLTKVLLSFKALISVVNLVCTLSDINDFDTVNNVYQMFFQEHFPARAAVQVE